MKLKLSPFTHGQVTCDSLEEKMRSSRLNIFNGTMALLSHNKNTMTRRNFKKTSLILAHNSVVQSIYHERQMGKLTQRAESNSNSLFNYVVQYFSIEWLVMNSQCIGLHTSISLNNITTCRHVQRPISQMIIVAVSETINTKLHDMCVLHM